MTLDELKEHCLKTLKQTEKFPTKTFEEHALVLQLIRNQTSVIEELEKIKDKAINLVCDCCIYANECPKDIKCSQYTEFSKQINNHIAELKGE